MHSQCDKLSTWSIAPLQAATQGTLCKAHKPYSYFPRVLRCRATYLHPQERTSLVAVDMKPALLETPVSSHPATVAETAPQPILSAVAHKHSTCRYYHMAHAGNPNHTPRARPQHTAVCPTENDFDTHNTAHHHEFQQPQDSGRSYNNERK